MRIDQLKVEVYGTRAEMGEAAALRVEKKLHELLGRQQTVNMIFAAAPSQNEFLRALRAAPVDWARIRAFHMDEYTGLPADAPQGFGNFLREHIFDGTGFMETHYINGNAIDPDVECKRYAALLAQYPPDVVCMGIGENGHIAFNDPPVADFADSKRVKVVELDTACRQQQVNDGCFATLPDVPTHAITLTVPALMAGKHVYCMVPGKLKATAVFNTLHQEIAEAYPSSVLRRHNDAVLYLDEASASKIDLLKIQA